MTERSTKTGKELERQVADAYRALGARKVEHDIELEAADRSLHRIADWLEATGGLYAPLEGGHNGF